MCSNSKMKKGSRTNNMKKVISIKSFADIGNCFVAYEIKNFQQPLKMDIFCCIII